jgi:hypothetical protein
MRSKIAMIVALGASAVGLWYGWRYESANLEEQARAQQIATAMKETEPVVCSVKAVHKGKL